MDIVTVFNYPNNKNYNLMFKIWIMQILKCKFKNKEIKNIIILTKKLSIQLNEFIKILNAKFIKIVICEEKNIIQPLSSKWKHNVGFKLYNLCRLKDPFIFIDADAIVIDNLDDPINVSKDKPLIGIDHQTIPGHTSHFDYKFINTGFLIVNDPSFLDYKKIINTPIKYRCPGTDQMLIFNYCKMNNYDYTHKLIHYGWNSCAKYKKKINNKIVSDGILESHEVHVLHYWFKFKPWITPCSIYKEFSQQIILFELLIQKIKIINPLKALLLFLKFQQYNKCNVLCDNEDLFEDIKILNLRGNTDSIDKNTDYDIKM